MHRVGVGGGVENSNFFQRGVVLHASFSLGNRKLSGVDSAEALRQSVPVSAKPDTHFLFIYFYASNSETCLSSYVILTQCVPIHEETDIHA